VNNSNFIPVFKILTASLTVFLILLFISACSDERMKMPAQEWNNITFEVETRPTRAVSGMNEFLVIASRNGKRVSEIIVSIQIMGTGEWRQAIQDGHIGVFRRSLFVRNPKEHSLLVRVRDADQENKDETILEFPLRNQVGSR